WILKVFLIGVVLNAACALVAYLLPHGIPGLNYGRDRLSGALLDPNAFGGIVMVALVVHGMTYRSAKPLIGGIRGAVCGCVLAIALVLTFSRSAWMGMGLGLGIAAYLRPRVLLSYVPLICLAAVLAVGAAMFSNRGVSKTLMLAERR